MLDRAAKPANPAVSITPNAATLPELFLKRADKTPHLAAYRRKINREWVAATWRDFAEAASALATFLLDRGLSLGDKLTIVGSTRPEWCISDVGGLLAGAVWVRDLIVLVASGTSQEGLINGLLFEAPLRALSTAVAGSLILVVFRGWFGIRLEQQ